MYDTISLLMLVLFMLCCTTSRLSINRPRGRPRPDAAHLTPRARANAARKHAGERELSTISGSRPFDSNRGELVLLCVVTGINS